MTNTQAHDGYRDKPRGGPRVRTDVVDVYLFREVSLGRPSPVIEFLQLLRTAEPLGATWQPLMGHIEAGESAVACALRELHEEVGLSPENSACEGVWALEQVHPFYLAAIDCIVLSPRFAVRVASDWRPRLNEEHSDHRWVEAADVPVRFMWPGQKRSCEEILHELARPGSLAAERLRIHPP